MNNLKIPEKKIDISYPSAWDEIEPEHAEKIGEIMYKCFTGFLDYDMSRKLAVDVFLNRVNGRAKPKDNEQGAAYWDIEARLADSVNFLFEHIHDDKEELTVSVNPKFCVQLVPVVKVGDRTYEGPKDLFADLTAWQWKEASWRIGKYAGAKEDSYLNELFAILYGKTEQGFEQALSDAGRVPIGIRFMIYLYFVGCMNWIREEPVEIDGSEIDFGCLFPKPGEGQSQKGESDNTGVAGILFQIAESGVFGNMEQVLKVNMWDIYLRLYQIHLQIKKLKI